MACPTCIVLDCENPSDVEQYTLQSGLIFTNSTLSFVLSCPTGYSCAEGYYPITVVIPPGAVQLPVNPTTFPTTEDINLRLDCCQSSISVTVPAGSTQAQLTAAAVALIGQCAAQQAACDVITDPPAPGVPPPMPVNPTDGSTTNVRVDLQSAAQTAFKVCGAGHTGTISYTLPAGAYGETLWNPTAAFIASRQSYLNGLATTAAQSAVDAITPPSISNTSPLASASIGVAYSVQLNGTGGTAPYTFALVSGQLPSGLTLSTSGLISGTPTTDDSETFAVSIRDSLNRVCSKEFEIAGVELCPSFIQNLTDAGMTGPTCAVSGASISKTLILCTNGNLQIIESVGSVDSIVATSTFAGGTSFAYGCYDPDTEKFFMVDSSNDEVLRINPTTGATEDSTSTGGSFGLPLSYNASEDKVIIVGDIGGGNAVVEIDPTTMAASNAKILADTLATSAFYCAAGNRVFVLHEPDLPSVQILNASTYATLNDFDLNTEGGGAFAVQPYDFAAAACGDYFFIGSEWKTGPTRMANKIAVINPTTQVFVGFIDITSEAGVVDIHWIEADEALGIIIVRADTKMVTIDANTLEVVCVSTTGSNADQFSVQPANSRIFAPNKASNNVAVYGH